MKVVVMIAMLLMSVTGFSQDTASEVKAAKRLVADETTWTDLKKSIKIETVNETIYAQLLAETESALKYVTIHYKPGKKYDLYFEPEEREQLTNWFDKLNKKTK